MRERNHFIGLWLNDEEYAHLREQCEIAGLPTSVLIRQAIEGVQLRHRPPDEYAALLRALSAISKQIRGGALIDNASLRQKSLNSVGESCRKQFLFRSF